MNGANGVPVPGRAEAGWPNRRANVSHHLGIGINSFPYTVSAFLVNNNMCPSSAECGARARVQRFLKRAGGTDGRIVDNKRILFFFSLSFRRE